MLRPIFALLTLTVLVAFAAWAEADYAHRHIANNWVGFCVDQTMGPPAGLTASPVANTKSDGTGTPQKAFALKVDDLDRRIATVRATAPALWTKCAISQRDSYMATLLWTRLSLGRWMPMPAASTLNEIEIGRAVERILMDARKVSEHERAWLAASPSPSDHQIEARLKGLRLVEMRDNANTVVKVMERPDRTGIVATLREMDVKARHASRAPAALGSAITVIALGVAVIWLLLAALRLPTGYLLAMTPIWMAGALLMVALSLGAPGYRTMAIRHLGAAGGLIWWPLLAAVAGFVLTRLARRDRWVAPAILEFHDSRGLSLRAGVVTCLAVAVGLVFPVDAHRSELWLALAALGMAIFAARNAMAMAVTQAPTSFGTSLVLFTGVCIALLAVAMKDLGSAVLVLSLLAGFFVMFTRLQWVVSCLTLMIAVLVWWSLQLQPTDTQVHRDETTAEFAQRVTEPCQGLPHERIRGAACLLASTVSDQYRALAMAKAGWDQSKYVGLGLVSLPASGLSTERMADREIRQLPMDFIAAPWVAGFGKIGLIALLVYVLTLLSLAARTLASLGGAGRSNAQHLLAGVAGFGLLAAAIRTMLSTAGALGAIALTGQPPPMLALGGSAAVAAGFYLGIALASQMRPQTD